MPGRLQVAVVGAGWSGIAAAVRARQAGHDVTLFDTAREAGGRARSLVRDGVLFDNGQHILIGAYTRTLDLMRSVGAQAEALLLRQPLTLRYPDGRELALPPGRPVVALLRGLTRARGLGWADRLALLVAASGWAARGFRCDPSWTVDHLCRSLPAPVRALLIDPLCVAALNTPANAASASVFLRVLHDALLSGPGSADLLLPRRPLGELLPQPALQWLAAQGAHLEFGHRVMDLTRAGPRWRVDDRCFDRVILACSANEAARLARGQATAAWLDAAETMPYEPIVTVFLEAPGARLPTPMMALMEGDDAPAQFVFDHGSISGQVGRLTCVVSGARRWVDAGLDATAAAVLGQAQRELAPWLGSAPVRVVQTIAEKRATFRCTPGLPRPEAWVAPGLMACGDYVQGPYPATLEGAVRAGEAAAAALNDAHQADARMRRP